MNKIKITIKSCFTNGFEVEEVKNSASLERAKREYARNVDARWKEIDKDKVQAWEIVKRKRW